MPSWWRVGYGLQMTKVTDQLKTNNVKLKGLVNQVCLKVLHATSCLYMACSLYTGFEGSHCADEVQPQLLPGCGTDMHHSRAGTVPV